MRATPEGTPTLTTVLLTGFDHVRLKEAELPVRGPMNSSGFPARHGRAGRRRRWRYVSSRLGWC